MSSVRIVRSGTVVETVKCDNVVTTRINGSLLTIKTVTGDLDPIGGEMSTLLEIESAIHGSGITEVSLV